MKNTDHLTTGYSDPAFARQVSLTVPGMASWAAGGPPDTACYQCRHFGYYKQIRNDAGDTIKTAFRPDCCAMFHKLTGKHGPRIPRRTESCRFFEPGETA